MADTSAATTEGAVASIPDYPMPRAAGCPFDPPPALRALQKEGPIMKVRLWDGSTPWLVTRYKDQRVLLVDPRISSDATRPGFPHSSAAVRACRNEGMSFSSKDDPEHARLRRMVTASFAIKRAEVLRPAIQRIVNGLIDTMLAGPRPVDLVQAFALPVPSLVICELLGVPYADHDFFQKMGKNLLSYATAPQQGLEAYQQLIDYLEDLLGHKLIRPGDDLLSQLAVQRVKTGELSRHDAAAMGLLLLVNGHGTTANMIAVGTLALLEHPDQLAALRETQDPKLIAGAVEELSSYSCSDSHKSGWASSSSETIGPTLCRRASSSIGTSSSTAACSGCSGVVVTMLTSARPHPPIQAADRREGLAVTDKMILEAQQVAADLRHRRNDSRRPRSL